MLRGTIVKNISNAYTVLCDDKNYICRPRGKFRQERITPLVGDKVEFDETQNYLLQILPRQNVLQRPAVANVDVALIVTSLLHPDFSSLLLDKEITCVKIAQIEPVICFTKEDLLTEEERKRFQGIRDYYEKIGIRTFSNEDISALISYLQDKIVVLTGQTGAGKSTLLNKIDPFLNLKTDEISQALNRGKHTTRHTEIFRTHHIWFVDTPGFSSLELKDQKKEDIKRAFQEFHNYSCKWRDCMHNKENFCGVKEAVLKKEILLSRYENYLKIMEEGQK